MKIAICGSMAFAKEMYDTGKQLELLGHEAYIPENVEKYISGDMQYVQNNESVERKIQQDLIKAHYDLIIKSDAILVLNKEKNNIPGYIGGNSFLEMGFAHVLGKKIFLLENAPDISYSDEILAMQPIVVGSDLSTIK